MADERGDLGPGYVHVYTGNGKGKTTAALGLALRAVGAGLPVFMAQFLKGQKYSELDAAARLHDLLTLNQYGGERFIRGEPTEEDIRLAREGLAKAGEVLASRKYRIVILDEAVICPALGLFTLEELLALVDSKPQGVELVLTGRNAPPELIDRADLVTEMVEIKHYFEKGVQARKGIEK
ncbi:MAG: cob(I)yrinic acid a,c-diamide adenosyltransferase [Planctomycetota bacterium]